MTPHKVDSALTVATVAVMIKPVRMEHGTTTERVSEPPIELDQNENVHHGINPERIAIATT